MNCEPRSAARNSTHTSVARSRSLFVAGFEAVSEWVSIAGARMGCRDPKDDKLLDTALLGRADCLVTGDQDLLVMSPFHGIPIPSPNGIIGQQ